MEDKKNIHIGEDLKLKIEGKDAVDYAIDEDLKEAESIVVKKKNFNKRIYLKSTLNKC